MNNLLKFLPKLNHSYVITRIVQFLRWFLDRTGLKGYVVGLSGGVDSSVTATLLVKAVGKDNVIGLIMPDPDVTPSEDVADAKYVAEWLGINYYIIPIDTILNSFRKSIPSFDENHYIAVGNLRARIRALILYYHANRFNMAVAGTGDKSEILLGYYTKYGDGAADILPIGDLYKTQVRELARVLGLPEKIYRKPSSPRLWKGQYAETELGAKYEEIDVVLYLHFEKRLSPLEISRKTGIDLRKVISILRRVYSNEHKRKYPLIPRLSSYAVTHDMYIPHISKPSFISIE